jgi:predicted nucleotidyltransferase
MTHADQNSELLAAMTREIVDEVHPEAIVLFGSRAAGDHNARSDVDLLIVLPDSEQARRKRRAIAGRLYRRLAHHGVSKDLLVYTRSEVDQFKGVPGHIVETCARRGVKLYAHA